MSRTYTAPYDASNISGARVITGFQHSLRVGDFIIISFGIMASHLVGLDGEGALIAPNAGHALPDDMSLDIAVGISWWFLLTAMSSYRERILGYGPDEYHRVLQASAVEFGSLTLLAFLTDAQLPGAYFLVTLPGGVALLLAWRWVARQYFVRARRRGAFTQPAFVIGSYRSVSAVIATISRRPELGLNPCGAFLSDDEPPRLEETHLPVPVIGGVENIDEAMDGADGIALLVAPASGLTSRALRRIGCSLGATSRLMVVHSVLDASASSRHLRSIGGMALHEIQFGTFGRVRLSMKRLIDILVSTLLIILLIPMWIVIPAIIWCDDRGPAFFRQTRVGRNGREFRIWKFRTMRVNADAELTTLLSQQGAGDKPLFKVAGDPRITRIGQWLRRTSLDEFPQLFNVFEGSMSLVGPRPQVPKEVELYDENAARRLLVKPGMTGLWQVNGRSSLSWEEALRFDLFYVENWTFLMDLVILLRTVKVVLAQEGSA